MVKRMTRAEKVALATELGHAHLSMGPTESGRRFWLRCSCGWGQPKANGQPSVTTATEIEGVKRLQYHLEKAVSDHLNAVARNGATPEQNVFLRKVRAG